MMNFEDMEKMRSIIEEKNEEIKRLTTYLEQERLRFKNELQERYEYYESILASMPGHVYWLDSNNVYLGCNDLQAKVADLRCRKEIVGKSNYDILCKEDAEELNRINDLVRETGIPHVVEEYAVMANGLRIYLTQKTPMRNTNNQIIGVLGISIDITEQKKIEAVLRRTKEAFEGASFAKAEFIDNIGQDIYTSICGIIGLVKLLEERTTNLEEKLYLRWISESGNQLLESFNGVVTAFSDEQLNEQNEVNLEICDLRKDIQAILRLILPKVKMKYLDLHLEIDEGLPQQLITDGVKIRRILLNLLSNTVELTDKGSITLEIKVCFHDGEYVQLQFQVLSSFVVPEELQDKIFNRFFRINSTEDKGRYPYGMGLDIAQNHVSQLGGEIKLTSELEKGSTFCFTLSMKVANLEGIDVNSVDEDELIAC
jgi:two-component system, OmpR family, aerobic respiration control sensor histidine kinase ArcB